MLRINDVKMIGMSVIVLLSSSALVHASCVATPSCAELGYTDTSCDSGKKSVKCPFDTSKIFCASPSITRCAVGDVFYKNKTCSPTTGNLADIIGIVGWVDQKGTSGLVVALDETQKTWSSEYYDLPCIANVDNTSAAQGAMGGKSNTQCIVQTANSRGVSYDAGTYCASYSYGGVGDWFLPSSGEAFQTLFQGKEYVNATLGKLGKTKIDTSGNYYWSSTESYYDYSSYGAWRLSPSDGNLGNGNLKTDTYRVRCVKEF